MQRLTRVSLALTPSLICAGVLAAQKPDKAKVKKALPAFRVRCSIPITRLPSGPWFN